MNADRSNKTLLLLVGILSGFIAGYLVGQQGRLESIPATVVALDSAIAPENDWIVDGLTCPAPGCMNPLQSCQSDISRRIRNWVNEQLRAGRSGHDIRQEIITTHGAAVTELLNGKNATPQDQRH